MFVSNVIIASSLIFLDSETQVKQIQLQVHMANSRSHVKFRVTRQMLRQTGILRIVLVINGSFHKCCQINILDY